MSENTITFTVADMSCNHCVKTIQTAFDTEMPDADVEIDIEAHQVSVAGDKAKAESIIREAGYTPVVAG